jgi:hypothetical protein
VQEGANENAVRAIKYAHAMEAALAAKGYTPGTRECYDKIDEALRQEFPEVVGAKPASSAPARQTPAVVNASRVNSAPAGKRVVSLTKTEREIADSMGYSYTEYAKMREALNRNRG